MDYQKMDNGDIEIIPGETPLKVLFETMARISYELARPVGMGYLQRFETTAEGVDFSRHMELKAVFEKRKWFNWLLGPEQVGEEVRGLNMDYVNGRQCKTNVWKNDEGKFVFNAYAYERDRGSPELFLDKVKSALERTVEDTPASKSDKPYYWDRVEMVASQYELEIDQNKPRESRLKVALALDKEGRQMEAIEIMTGEDFDPHGVDGMLLLTYKMDKDTPENFYGGFPDIDGS